MQVRWTVLCIPALLVVLIGVPAPAQDADLGARLAKIRAVGADGAPLAERQAAADALGEPGAADLAALWETLEAVQIFRHNREQEAERLEKRIGTLRRLGDGPRDTEGQAKKELGEKREEHAKIAAEIEAENAIITKLLDATGGAFSRAPDKGQRAAVAPLLMVWKETGDLFRRERLASLFGRFPTEAIRRELLAALNDDHLPVRVEAAKSLSMHATAESAKTGGQLSAQWEKLYGKLPRELTAVQREQKKLHKEYVKHGKKFVKKSTRKPGLVPTGARNADEKRFDAGHRLAELDRVVEAFRELLAKLHASLSPEARTAQLTPLLEKLGRARKPEDAVFLVETISFIQDVRAREALESLIGHESAEVRIAICEALARQGDPKASIALTKAVEDPLWQVRVAAIDALRQLGGRDAVDGLIVGMGKAEGRVIHDLATALQALTGQNFHDNKVLWKNWWKKNRAAYEGPPAVAKVGKKPTGKTADDTPAPRGDRVSFYGIETKSKRIVYILDVSGSMQWPLSAYSAGGGRPPLTAQPGNRKFDHAVKELKRSITSLPKGSTFNIVCYSDVVTIWQKSLIEATTAQKQKAFDWVDSAVVDGATNIFDGVERAFGLAGRGTKDKRYGIAADTFYLLTDGRANRGRVIDSDAMISEIGRLNKFHRVVIHTIGLGRDADWEFMEELAAKSGGQCILITGKK